MKQVMKRKVVCMKGKPENFMNNNPIQNRLVGMTAHPQSNNIKSPSDTTIYAPALRLTPPTAGVVPQMIMNNQTNVPGGITLQRQLRQINCTQETREEVNEAGDSLIKTNVVNKISKFLDQVRVESEMERASEVRAGREQQPQPSTSCPQPPPQPGPSGMTKAKQIEEADCAARELTIQNERFKASTELPQGGFNNLIMSNPQMAQMPQIDMVNGQILNQGITDDEFFHLTCHVDPNLKAKIEKGEFVDLETLLTKDKFRNNNLGQRMELVSRGGKTYIMPVETGTKITNVRKWEQAFRIYAAIYSQANPSRSAEIWQYVFVINSAASTYLWENVANYDYTFRQLMACNPMRNWSNIYLQMWNLTMRDVIPRNTYGTLSFDNNNPRRNSSGKRGKKGVSYCWSFNRGEKCKFDPNCKFIKRCSYCDSAAHGQFECPRLIDRKPPKN